MAPDAWMTPAIVATLASVVAGVTDTLRFKVYNVLTLPVALSGIVYHSVANGRDGFVMATVGLGLGLAVLLIPYLFGALGAGDVKFFAAVSAWLGTAPMFTILASACIAAGLYSTIVLLRRDGWRGVVKNLYMSLAELLTLGFRGPASARKPSVQEVLATSPDCHQRLVPFSAMIGVGVLTAIARQALTGF